MRTVMGAAMLALLLAGCSGDSGNGYEAEYMCEEFAKDRLKAPSTAEFDLDHERDGQTYEVSGTVDAENSFGAKIRGNLRCTVRDGDGEWTLLSIDVPQ